MPGHQSEVMVDLSYSHVAFDYWLHPRLERVFMFLQDRTSKAAEIDVGNETTRHRGGKWRCVRIFVIDWQVGGQLAQIQLELPYPTSWRTSGAEGGVCPI